MEVAEAYVSILPSTKGFARQLDGQISGDLSRSGKTGGKAFAGGMAGAVGGMASKVFAPLAAAGAALSLGKVFADGVRGASDLAESTAAVNVVFGQGASAVRDFAKGAAGSLGQTQVQALSAAKTFGTFGKAAGLTGDQLATFSTDFVGLASDLASFNNTSPEDAITAIGAALRGETEPIRQYGVLLDDASLRQEALAQGLIATTKQALTPQQKVLAAQALIYKQTADAQGDFARTSDGLANQQRILSAQWTELKTTLGGALLPAVTKIAQLFNRLLGPAIEAAGPFVARLSEAFAGMFDGLSGGQSALSPLVEGFKSFGKAVGPAFVSLVGSLRDYFGSLLPVFQKVGSSIMATLGPGLAAIGNVIGTKLIPAVQAILPVLAPVARFLVETLGGAITGALSGAIKVITGVLQALSGLVSFVANVFTGNWGAAWGALKDVAAGVFKAIIGAAQVFLNVGIVKVFRVGLSLLSGVWRGALNALKGAASGVWNGIKGLFSGALSAIGKLIVSGVKAYIGLWKGLLSGLLAAAKAGWNLIRGAFTGALSAVRNAISGALSGIVGAFRRITSGLLSSARDGIGNVVGVFRGIKDKVVGALSGAAGWLVGVGRNIVSGLISGIRAMAGAIGRALLDILPGPLRKFAGALGINSPSTVFAEFGRNIGQGLIVGMAATEAEVTRGVGRLAAAATAGTAPARRAATARLTTPAAATAPAGPGVVFTGPITTTDVGAMADRILERQRDALALVSVVV